MKKIIWLLGLILLFLSCKEKEIYISKLQEKNGITYKINQTQSFTGKAIAKDENGELKSEENYSNGVLNGPLKRYSENGQLISEENYKNGELELDLNYNKNKIEKLRINGNIWIENNEVKYVYLKNYDDLYHIIIYSYKNKMNLRNPKLLYGERREFHIYTVGDDILEVLNNQGF